MKDAAESLFRAWILHIYTSVHMPGETSTCRYSCSFAFTPAQTGGTHTAGLELGLHFRPIQPVLMWHLSSWLLATCRCPHAWLLPTRAGRSARKTVTAILLKTVMPTEQTHLRRGLNTRPHHARHLAACGCEIYTHLHTYIHTYIHTYMHACIHTYAFRFVHVYTCCRYRDKHL